jgi:hypothetical protein
MKFVLATPLYPPDIAEPAPYVKELARRLSSEHQVTILAYARLPEAVPGVRIVAVDKRQPVLFRLFAYAVQAFQLTRDADAVIVENGASVELPFALLGMLFRRAYIFHIGDAAAHARAPMHPLLQRIEQFAAHCASTIIADMPPQRPERIPFLPPPEQAEEAYEAAWSRHLEILRHAYAK